MNRSQMAERLRKMAEGRRRDIYEYVWPDEMPAIIGALEAGASALAREQEMVEALRAITAHMDRAGGDAYGMPECPWCKAGPHGDDHRGDCELSKAREVLAKAEIPHD